MTHAFDLERFTARLRATADAVDAKLAAVIDPDAAENGPTPPRLAAAMKHAVLAGGKRFRPYLVVQSAALFDDRRGDRMLAAVAVECLHTYSLVHDDLPAMDDDDLRRGLPTVHRAFDEATAILAGDALLTLAFELLARPAVHPEARVRADLVGLLARAAGRSGMVGGQMLDLEAEAEPARPDATERMQAMKTGALFSACCEMGAVIGGAGVKERGRIAVFGRTLGRAFQIADDLLDVESTSADLGKAARKDSGRGKATFVALLGRDGARARLAETVAEAVTLLAPFGEAARPMIDAASFVAERKS